MPESNHEVVIDGYVYPDTVTITLANDDFIGSRDYVSKDLYESISSANDYWQAENGKLRELVRGLWYCAHEAYGMCARVPVGGERPFTCCPLYDYDSKVYRCEKLILELGV